MPCTLSCHVTQAEFDHVFDKIYTFNTSKLVLFQKNTAFVMFNIFH